MTRLLTMGQPKGLVAAIVAATVACAPMPVTADQPDPDLPSDGQILAIAIALNEGGMAASRVAAGGARQDEIRRFAARTLMEQGSVLERLTALDIDLESHPLAVEFSETARSTAAVLTQSRRRLFDAAFIDAEISLLQYSLDTIQEVLIPNARDKHLRGVLHENRMVLIGQLGEARHLRATMESGER